MSLLKSCAIAFSMYSRIPVPQFEWKENDMRHMLCFFPLIGVGIGALTCLWFYIAGRFAVGTLCMTVIGTAIPLMVTGGIHMDGYMDTSDALRSCKPCEKKLEILSDPHIGSFAVLMLVLYFLTLTGAYSQISTIYEAELLGTGFVLSRVFSGLGVELLKPAKKEGLGYTFAEQSAKKKVCVVLLIEGIATAAFLLWLSVRTALIMLLGALLLFLWYRRKSYAEFGGVTGDTAGWFLSLCELWFVIAIAVSGKF